MQRKFCLQDYKAWRSGAMMLVNDYHDPAQIRIFVGRSGRFVAPVMLLSLVLQETF
jgi:hypothetical protein